MFGYRSNVPKVRLTTDRLVVRLVHERDAASGGLLRRESPVLKPPGTSFGMRATATLPAGRRASA